MSFNIIRRFLGFNKFSVISAVFIAVNFLLLGSFFGANSVSAAEPNLELSSSGHVNITANPGNTAITSSEIHVATDCKAGYYLTLNTSVNDNNLYLDGDTESASFTPTNGALDQSPNTWGYFITTPASIPASSSSFKSVPALGLDPAPLKTPGQTASETNINEKFLVYYGVYTSINQTNGTYKLKQDDSNTYGTLIYTLTANPSCVPNIDISFNKNLDGQGGETPSDPEDIVSNFPTSADNTIDTTNNTVTLSNETPTRPNYTFKEWNLAADGTGNSYYPGDVINIGTGSGELTGNITMYAIWEIPITPDPNSLIVNYHGNGLIFDGNAGTNLVKYHNSTTTSTDTVTRYSHTSNINDEGTWNDPYDNDQAYKDVVTIPGATELDVTLYYSTESGYDRVYVMEGNYTGEITSDLYDSSQIGTYEGDYGTDMTGAETASFTVQGDTVTFGFYSDSSSNEFYGYYAVITAEATTTVHTLIVDEGTYSTPTSNAPHSFLGWSEDRNATTPTYVDEDDIKLNLPGEEGDVVDLYAVYDLLYTVTVNLDEHSRSVTFSNPNHGTQEVVNPNVGNGPYTSTVTLAGNTIYDIVATFDAGYVINSWSATEGGTIGNTARKSTTIAITNDITLTLTSAEAGPFTVYYHGNGLAFDGGTDTNAVEYINSTYSGIETVTRYSHTSNINDEGTWNDPYDNDQAYKDVVTIPGATELDVTLYYSTESGYDRVYVMEGNYTGEITSDLYDSSQIGTYEGDYGTDMTGAETASFTVQGDTVTFGFYSDVSSNEYYGYYAVVTAEANVTVDSLEEDVGTYAVPTSNDPHILLGWSEDQNATSSTYKDEEDIKLNLPWEEGGTVDLYAIHVPAYAVTVNLDEHSQSVTFSNPDYGTQEVVNPNVGNGSYTGTVNLVGNTIYDTTATLDSGYKIDSWSTTQGGTIGDNTSANTTFIVTDTTTLSLSSSVMVSTLLPGTTLRDLLVGVGDGYASSIEALRTANSLPDGFVPSSSNTVSTVNSDTPIYIFMDYIDGLNTICFYTEAKTVYMNEDSRSSFSDFYNLSDISALSSWDTINVADMSSMFYNASSLANIDDLASWDTSNVTNMSYMFDRANITNIDGATGWDTGNVINMSHMFSNTYSLTDIDGALNWDTINVADMSSMFYNASSLANIDGALNWDTDSVADMSSMFYNASSLTNIDGALNWDTDSVLTMNSMFRGASSLADIDGAINWGNDNVTDMSYMFSDTSSLTNIDGAANWNTGNVTNMEYMFSFYTQNYQVSSSLADIDGASGWDTSNVTNMRYMFAYASALTDITALSNWNTSSVTNMQLMFSKTSIIDASAINDWEINSVTVEIGGSSSSNNNFYKMFYQVGGYNSPIHPEFTKRAGTWNTDGTFIPSYTSTLLPGNGLAISTLRDKIASLAGGEDNVKAIRKANSLPSGFTPTTNNTISTSDSEVPTYIFLSDSGVINYYSLASTIYLNENSRYAFSDFKNLSDISGLSYLDSSNVVYMDGMFALNYDLGTSLKNVNALADWDTSNVIDMSNMFDGNCGLTNINGVSNWNTSNVTNMSGMFMCFKNSSQTTHSSLANINGLANWDTSNVTNMSGMFDGAEALTNVNALSDWDVSNVTDMEGMFHMTTSLSDLSGLANWNVGNVVNMRWLFGLTDSLTNVDALLHWDVSNVTNMERMFGSANNHSSSLADISGLRNWNVSNVTDMSQMFCATEALTDLSPLANWNVSSVTSMYSMFNDSGFSNINALSSWDTGNVTNMTYMFLRTAVSDASPINDWDITSVVAPAGSSDSNKNRFYRMFYQFGGYNSSIHPEFTKRQGSWDSDGTFIPNDTIDGNVTVTVNFDSNISGVRFYCPSLSGCDINQTITTSGDTISLYRGSTYYINAIPASGYELATWDPGEKGIIKQQDLDRNFAATYEISGVGKAAQFTPVGDTTLTASSRPEQHSNISTTVSMDSNISKIIFRNDKYGTISVSANGAINYSIINSDGTITNSAETGDTINLKQDVTYKVTASVKKGYEVSSWTTTGGTISSNTGTHTNFTPNSNSTLSVSSRSVSNGQQNNNSNNSNNSTNSTNTLSTPSTSAMFLNTTRNLINTAQGSDNSSNSNDLAGATTDSTSIDSSNLSYNRPQGVQQIDTFDSGDNIAPAFAIAAVTSVASGAIFFILARRRKDEDDE